MIPDTLAHNESGYRFQAYVHRDDRHRPECDDSGVFAEGHQPIRALEGNRWPSTYVLCRLS